MATNFNIPPFSVSLISLVRFQELDSPPILRQIFQKYFPMEYDNKIWLSKAVLMAKCSIFSLSYPFFYSQKQPERCSVKKGVLRNFAKFAGKHQSQRLFFNTVAGQKESLAEVFSFEFCEIPKNTFSSEHFQTTASVFSQSCLVNEL